MAKTRREKDVSTLIHDKAVRLNNPTAEMASLYEQEEMNRPGFAGGSNV